MALQQLVIFIIVYIWPELVPVGRNFLIECIVHNLKPVWLQLPLTASLQLALACSPVFSIMSLHSTWHQMPALRSIATALAILAIPAAIAVSLQLSLARHKPRPKLRSASTTNLRTSFLTSLLQRVDKACDKLELRLYEASRSLHPSVLLACACYPLLAYTGLRQLAMLVLPSLQLQSGPLEVLMAMACTALVCKIEAGTVQRLAQRQLAAARSILYDVMPAHVAAKLESQFLESEEARMTAGSLTVS